MYNRISMKLIMGQWGETIVGLKNIVEYNEILWNKMKYYGAKIIYGVCKIVFVRWWLRYECLGDGNGVNYICWLPVASWSCGMTIRTVRMTDTWQIEGRNMTDWGKKHDRLREEDDRMWISWHSWWNPWQVPDYLWQWTEK